MRKTILSIFPPLQPKDTPARACTSTSIHPENDGHTVLLDTAVGMVIPYAAPYVLEDVICAVHSHWHIQENERDAEKWPLN